MFDIGDKVAHPGHGGCMVADICVQNRGATPVKYLVLVPQGEPETRILAPVENLDQIGLRSVITPETADELLDSFTHGEEGLVWEDNHAKRRQSYVDILKTGSLQSLADMIRALSLRQKLNSADKELLPRAQKRLFSEIAMAKEMDYQCALDIALHHMEPSGVSV